MKTENVQKKSLLENYKKYQYNLWKCNYKALHNGQLKTLLSFLF